MAPEPQESQPRREMTSEERSRVQLQAIEDDGDEIEDIDLEGDNEEEDEEDEIDPAIYDDEDDE